MPDNCPYYDQCPHKMGDDTEHGIKCQEEGFIDLEDGGILCLAWDIQLPEEVKYGRTK